jgi:hypothetical protein
MPSSRKYAANTRGRPFQPGNSGKPKGARHAATLAAEALLDSEAEALTRKAIEAAMGGDSVALRLCLDRVVPPRRERPTRFSLPQLKTAEDAAMAMSAITVAVAQGELTMGEAESMGRLVESFVRALEAGEHEQRLRALEEKAQK